MSRVLNQERRSGSLSHYWRALVVGVVGSLRSRSGAIDREADIPGLTVTSPLVRG